MNKVSINEAIRIPIISYIPITHFISNYVIRLPVTTFNTRAKNYHKPFILKYQIKP